MKFTEKIRQFFLWKIMNQDEKAIWLRREAQKLHNRQAKREKYVGHTDECCDRLLIK